MVYLIRLVLGHLGRVVLRNTVGLASMNLWYVGTRDVCANRERATQPHDPSQSHCYGFGTWGGPSATNYESGNFGGRGGGAVERRCDRLESVVADAALPSILSPNCCVLDADAADEPDSCGA